MNNKAVEIIISVIVFLVILILSFSFTIEKTKEETEKLYESPLTKVTILENNISLEPEKRTYNAIVDCSKYEENTPIIDYKLSTKRDVIVRSKFYKDNILLEEPQTEMTNFEIYLSLINEKNEMVYHFNLVCGENYEWEC